MNQSMNASKFVTIRGIPMRVRKLDRPQSLHIHRRKSVNAPIAMGKLPPMWWLATLTQGFYGHQIGYVSGQRINAYLPINAPVSMSDYATYRDLRCIQRCRMYLPSSSSKYASLPGMQEMIVAMPYPIVSSKATFKTNSRESSWGSPKQSNIWLRHPSQRAVSRAKQDYCSFPKY